MKKHTIIRITTVPISLRVLLKGQLRYMSKYFEIKAVSSPSSELDLVAEIEGIKVSSVKMSREITPIKDIRSLWNMYRLLRRNKPMIVHTHTPKAGVIGMIASLLAGIPIRMHTVAGLPLMEARGVKRIILNLVEKITYRCATHVYPNSRGLFDFILENKFVNLDKLKVIGNGSSNGINTEFFNPDAVTQVVRDELNARLGIRKVDFVFIFVGRIVGDKGINELITAFLKIQDNSEFNAKLLLVGELESDLDPLSVETLKEIENNNSIISVGFQRDVRPYFAISDVLVFPSYREGFPNVVMQAGAMGLASIVSDINGCNEIIIEGTNGLIVPPKSSLALAQAMKKVILRKDLLYLLKQNARPMIIARYEQNIVWEEILKEYNMAIEQIKEKNV
ncbi:MAG: glycosyl transferase group 1 [Sphingobacterium sp.]|nr:glycosyl transferase group 1 [Sphingobacterium sp.]